MKVLVKKMNKKAVIPFKTYDKDFCYDVVATSCEEVAPNVYKYGIGLAFEIDRQEMMYEDAVRLIETCFDEETGKQYTFIGSAGIKYDESKIKISIDLRPRSPYGKLVWCYQIVRVQLMNFIEVRLVRCFTTLCLICQSMRWEIKSAR